MVDITEWVEGGEKQTTTDNRVHLEMREDESTVREH